MPKKHFTENMATSLVFSIGMLSAAFIASTDTTCPYDSIARCNLILTEIASGLREGSDSNDSSSNDRSDAYKHQGKWSKNYLTYTIVKYSTRVSKSVVDDAITRAFKLWSDAANLTFERRNSSSADIRIEFVPHIAPNVTGRSKGPHSSETLKLADDVRWTVDSHQGTNLRVVAAHEIGHALGLGHSDDYHAIMYYKKRPGYNPKCGLGSDDIKGIQALYGKPVSKSTAPGPTSRAPDPPSRAPDPPSRAPGPPPRAPGPPPRAPGPPSRAPVSGSTALGPSSRAPVSAFRPPGSSFRAPVPSSGVRGSSFRAPVSSSGVRGSSFNTPHRLGPRERGGFSGHRRFYSTSPLLSPSSSSSTLSSSSSSSDSSFSDSSSSDSSSSDDPHRNIGSEPLGDGGVVDHK